MLKIYYGDMPEAIYNTSVYFNNIYLDKWFDDKLSLQMIKAIDKGEVVSPQCIITKALGAITAKELAGGTKTLLLMRNAPDKIYNASTCGDNCSKWILKIAKEAKEDLIINLHHFMHFEPARFEICILNTGEIANTPQELIEKSVGLV